MPPRVLERERASCASASTHASAATGGARAAEARRDAEARHTPRPAESRKCQRSAVSVRRIWSSHTHQTLSVACSSWRSRTKIRMFTEHCRSLNVRSLFAFDNRWPLHERTVRSLFVLFPFRDMSVCSLFETYLGNRTTWNNRDPIRCGHVFNNQGTEFRVEADGPVRVPDFHGS